MEGFQQQQQPKKLISLEAAQKVSLLAIESCWNVTCNNPKFQKHELCEQHWNAYTLSKIPKKFRDAVDDEEEEEEEEEGKEGGKKKNKKMSKSQQILILQEELRKLRAGATTK